MPSAAWQSDLQRKLAIPVAIETTSGRHPLVAKRHVRDNLAHPLDRRSMLDPILLEHELSRPQADSWNIRPPVAGTLMPLIEALMLSEKRKYPTRDVVEGYRPKQKIVRFAGRAGRMEEFHYAFVFPDTGEAAPRPASSFQVAAFMRRVGFRVPEGATMDQVSQVLSAQEFATRILDSRSAPSAAARNAIIRFAVGFISAQPKMRLDIRRRMRMHHEGIYDPFLPVAPYYRPPKHMTAIARFADAVVADMRAAGAVGFG
jgi:hypothetical protein